MKYSIISVVLNDLPGLRRTWDSIACQGCLDFEWLVLDGGSSDGTVEWLTEHPHDSLRWWSESDDGLYDAMNHGIDHACGEYLIFLNAGDEFADQHVLERMNVASQKTPTPDFIYGDTIDVATDGRTYFRAARSHEARWFTMFACHQAMAFRRMRIGDLRYKLKYRNAADYQFVAQFLTHNHRDGEPIVERLDGPVCRFWLGGNSWLHRTTTLSEDFEIRRTYLGVSTPANVGLFLAHRAHTWLKRNLFGLSRRLRW